MHADPIRDPAPAAVAPSTEDQTAHWHAQLRQACAHLAMSPTQIDQVLADEALQIDGIGFALRLNPAMQQLEFFADCGTPPTWEAPQVHRHLLEDALCNEMPALSFAAHPQSHHIVLKGCLSLAAVDAEGWLFTAALLTAVGRVRELQQHFTLEQTEA